MVRALNQLFRAMEESTESFYKVSSRSDDLEIDTTTEHYFSLLWCANINGWKFAEGATLINGNCNNSLCGGFLFTIFAKEVCTHTADKDFYWANQQFVHQVAGMWVFAIYQDRNCWTFLWCPFSVAPSVVFSAKPILKIAWHHRWHLCLETNTFLNFNGISLIFQGYLTSSSLRL